MLVHPPHRKLGLRFPAGASLFMSCLVLGACGTAALQAQQPSSREVVATSCFLRTDEEADIPALERGLITKILFSEGDVVLGGSVITVLDDAESRLRVEMAKIDVDLAEKRLVDSYALQIADAKVKETRQLIEKSKVEQQIASQNANSNVAVRMAQKSLDTSQADVDRALAARKEFAGSVSNAELSRLLYLRDRSQLDIESAEEAQAIALLEVGVERASVATAEAILERLLFEQSQTATNNSAEQIELERLKLQLQLTETQHDRRRIVAPFTGMLVEQFRHRGEWLELGEPIFRLIRLDRLVVEGYANSEQVHHAMRGVKVRVVPLAGNSVQPVEGTLTFVSPEIDSVNQQVQIRAIIDNTNGELRAGQAVGMTILTP